MGGQAFSGKRLNGFHKDPDELCLVGLDTDDGPEHPLYDPRVKLPADENLAKDIMVNGVLQPIRVRKNGDLAEVAIGRQRVKACRLANKWLREQGKEPISVPFLLHRAASEADFLGICVSENEHRKPDDVVTKAQKAERLLSMGKDYKEVALRFGVTPATVRNWQAVLNTSAQVKKAVSVGKISATAAGKLSKLSHKEQDTALKELVESGNTTVAASRERAKGGKPRDKNLAPSKGVLKSIIAHGGLSEEVRTTLEWCAGSIPTPPHIRAVLDEL